MTTKCYYSKAQDDAADMVEYFIDEVVEQLIEKAQASDDFLNDYNNGDSYHHETHVDRFYSLRDAVEVIVQLDQYEETDSGLWEGLDMKRALECCAAYTYGNAVYSMAQDLIQEINDDYAPDQIEESAKNALATEKPENPYTDDDLEQMKTQLTEKYVAEFIKDFRQQD